MKGIKGVYIDKDNNLFSKPYGGKKFIIKVGETYKLENENEIEICYKGFHFCKSYIDLLEFYPPMDNVRYVEIEAKGKIEEHTNMGVTKYVSSEIEILRLIDMQEYKENFRAELEQKNKFTEFDGNANCSSIEQGKDNYKTDGAIGANYTYKSVAVAHSKNIIKSEAIAYSNNICESNTVIHGSMLENVVAANNCDYVIGASAIKDSSYIINGCGIIKSHSVWNSENILRSYTVKDSNNIMDSYCIEYCNNITNSFFIKDCDNIKNSLFCVDIDNKENYLFNKEVDEDTITEIQYDLRFMLNELSKKETIDYSHRLLEYPKIVDYNGKLFTVDISTAYSNLPDAIIDYIKTIKQFDNSIYEKIFYNTL